MARKQKHDTTDKNGFPWSLIVKVIIYAAGLVAAYFGIDAAETHWLR